MTTRQMTPYGTLSTGEEVARATLTAGNGVSVSVIGFGGIITAIHVPDRDGRLDNVVLGFPDLEAYEAHNGSCHFGALIGRFANRIARGRFTLDGREYQLPINNGANSLHGGPKGFGRRLWDLAPDPDDEGGVLLSLVSADGEAGYPGTVRITVAYRLGDDGALRIDYTTTTDQLTILNLTNHTYFNLAGNGSGSVADQVVRIEADHYTPVDETLIPTGEIATVDGTPMDFRSATAIGARLREPNPQLVLAMGYDHNWVIRPGTPGALPGALTEAAHIHDPATGRTLTCLTTQPGVQFYTGNSLDGSKPGSAGTLYRQTEGFTLETQHFPDSPNQPNFPSTLLRPGETYRHSTVFRFGTM